MSILKVRLQKLRVESSRKTKHHKFARIVKKRLEMFKNIAYLEAVRKMPDSTS